MNELLGRQAPHSASAEQAVLGSMLIDPQCISEVIDKVKADDFYIQQNREIFETMFAMFAYGQTIDPVTVLDQMRVRGVYKEGSSQQYLMELMQITPTAANVLEYAAIVRDRALLRTVLQGLCLLFRDACVLRAGGGSCRSPAPEEARRLSRELTRESLARLLDAANRAAEQAERNANSALLVTALCASLRQAAGR